MTCSRRGQRVDTCKEGRIGVNMSVEMRMDRCRDVHSNMCLDMRINRCADLQITMCVKLAVVHESFA